MKNNHPNRNWRRTARIAAADWVARRWSWPVSGDIGLVRREDIESALRIAYQAGYEARHKRDQEKSK